MSSFLNHLEGQQSPYLLQHIHNPVDWFPWGQEALDLARAQQKPILLSIGYSTCHWCHVMAHESFEDETIAKIINTHFIAIKVDREERPDLDQIYMNAVTALTGQGGWPLTVFLTPEARPFYGGTYFPPHPKYGSPGFADLLTTIARAWNEQREALLRSSHEITDLLKEQTLRFKRSHTEPDDDILKEASLKISRQFDWDNGGFGHAPKFPMGHSLAYLLRHYKRSQDKNFLEMTLKSLDAMASGGIYDHLGGGFHRYSTDAHWHVPHFEKMLYDQALLVNVYVEAYQITGSLAYARIIKETLDYVGSCLSDAHGGFYCAEDADSKDGEGTSKEGAYYVWSKQEIYEALDKDDAEIFCYLYGVVDNGNALNDPHGEFTGKNILYQAHTIEEAASYFNTDNESLEEALSRSRNRLLSLRDKRSRPHLDDKVLVDWNGLMISAYSVAGVVLDDPAYIKRAAEAADFILKELSHPSGLMHSWRKEPSGIQATLEDYAFFINGLLDLYQASGNERYIIRAKELATQMIELFEDREEGGFFLTASNALDLIIRPKDIYDGAIPSGNSMAAYALNRLYLHDGSSVWLKPLKGIFMLFGHQLKDSPSAHTFALSALDLYLQGGVKVLLEGPPDEEILVQMKKMVYKHFIPSKMLCFKTGVSVRAFVCQGNECHQPVNDVKKLEALLIEG